MTPSSTEQAVARAFARAADSTEAYELVLEALGTGMGWELGAVWEPVPGDEVLRCVALWVAEGNARAQIFADVTRAPARRPGEGLPGRVWERGRPAWIVDFT